MAYQHRWLDGRTIDLPLGKIVCVGRNYAAHARELNNPVPKQPLLFIKPASSAVPLDEPLLLPRDRGPVHYEAEIAVLIGQSLCRASEEQVVDAVQALGVALDLTLRELQAELKAKGHPWELAKSFDGACPLSPWVSSDSFADLNRVPLRLTLNDELRQQGDSGQMLWPMVPLIAHISRYFSLQPGDVVLTGTPAGVGALSPGDRLRVALPGACEIDTIVRL